MDKNLIKTGTTCIGMLFKDGVMIGADRRMTAGYIASNSSTKVYEVSNNMVATTAGNAAANQLVMRHLRSEIKLLGLKKESEVFVKEGAMILNSIQYSIIRSQGEVVSCIFGGFDKKLGKALYNLSPDGTIIANPGYAADGSGSVYVKGVLDTQYKSDLKENDALSLMESCFKASFSNDNMSGGGFIIKIITKDGIKEISRKKVTDEIVEEK